MNVRNIAAYFNERFPLVNMLLFSILFLTVYSVAAYFSSEVNVTISQILIGIVAVISFFFRLRVFDEIKDFKIDAVNHPQRVLQSGRVSLRQLMLISSILTASEILWSYWNGTPTIICWLIAIIYSLLMRFEFFIGVFLKKRLFIYACTHMLIMPLIILWIWSAFIDELHHPGLYLLGALSLLGGFCFEIARKIHVAAAEKSSIDSYSKNLGFITSIICVLLFLLAGVLVQCYLLYVIQATIWSYLLIGLLYIGTCIVYIMSIKHESQKRLRLAELFVSLFMLLSYVSIIIEIHFL